MSTSRSWFFPTSPRSPGKIQGELRILKKFEGSAWNPYTQTRFMKELARYEDFEGYGYGRELAFSARDRINRAPRLLGFVYLPHKKDQPFIFTGAGNELINANEEELPFLFQRQICKVQFSSPLHNSKGFNQMKIRPLTAMIYLLESLETLSKEEIALFALPTLNYEDLDDTIESVEDFRNRRRTGSRAERKSFRELYPEERIREIYKEDIERGEIKTRENEGELATIEEFVRKKISNLRDYADATTRYLRATGIFTIDVKTQRLRLSTLNYEDASYLLDKVGLKIVPFESDGYEKYVLEYLGNPQIPQIRKDDLKSILEGMEKVNSIISRWQPDAAKGYMHEFSFAQNAVERRAILQRASIAASKLSVTAIVKEERRDFQNSFKRLHDFYEQIADRSSEIYDRPVQYEWNTWKALELLDHARLIKPNLTLDVDGSPLTVAGGRKPDIEVEFSNFWLLVEVTLSSGVRQYETEGEPIMRHLGEFRKSLKAGGDNRPVYGFLISEKIQESVITYLNQIAYRKSQVYDGYVRIIPLNRSEFENIVRIAQKLPPDEVESAIRDIIFYAFEDKMKNYGELDWVQKVLDKISSYLVN